LPSTIAASGTANLTVNLTTSAVGFKFGAVQFTTNDPDTPTFNFNVSGTVTGSAPAGAPVISLPAPALDYEVLEQSSLIDSTATVIDADSANFGGGNLKVEFTSVSSAKDALGIRDAGSGAGQIGVSGSNVTYGGTSIGTFTGGSNAAPLIVSLNANATPAAAQALARSITFSTTATDPETLVRYVRFTLVDGPGGNTSNLPFAVVDQNLRPTTVSIAGGDLVIADSSRMGKDDNWKIERLGDNLKLTDVSGNTIDALSILGAVGSGTPVVTVPLNVFSSTGRLVLDMRQGSDALTIDIAGGSPVPTGGILYVGNPPLGRGDKLTITNGGQGTATYNADPNTATFTGVPDGSQVPYGATTLIVNYHRGDGNDVALVPNHPPTANAGGSYSVTYGDGVTLDGSGSADPDNDSLSYSWTINGQAGAASGVHPAISWSSLAGLGLSSGNSYPVSVIVDDGHGNVVVSGDTTLSVIPAASLTSVSADDAVYDGDAHAGSAYWTSAGNDGEGAPLLNVSYVGINGTIYGPSLTAPTDAGSYEAQATFSGDGNHTGSSGFADFNIYKAVSITVTVGDGPFSYDGTTHVGGSGTVSGAGGLSTFATSLTYSGDQVNAGLYYVSAHYAGDANHEASDGEAVAITIDKADAVFSIPGYSVLYDGQPHTSAGTATGVSGEDLSGLLDLSGTTHSDPANYLDLWSFAGSSNYKSATGIVADTIAFPTDGFSVQTQAALNTYKSGEIVATVRALGVYDQATLDLLASGSYAYRFVFTDSIATVTVSASLVAGSYLGTGDTDFALVYRNTGASSPLSALVSSANTSANTAMAVTFSVQVNIDGTWYELGSDAIRAFLSKK
jgi:hypothetical protein